MDGVCEKLAVVIFLVYWSSQVEAQGEGKHYISYTILQCAVHGIFMCNSYLQVSICKSTEQEFQTMVLWHEGIFVRTAHCSV